MSEIVLATRNRGKVREIKGCLEREGWRAYSLEDFPEVGEVEEKGDTFTENALSKARTVARLTGRPALADDSGLEVDALDGKPGVLSARFAGQGATDEENNEKLLELLEGVPPERRGASFRCVLAIVWPSGEERIIEEDCRGMITSERRGTGGFGYDPLFFFPPLGKTFAELDQDEKNRVSHRGKALRRLKDVLRQEGEEGRSL
ncbi:MAG: XTP/dITP diphosphatase [Deltaproteobacteria bacterium]|nr:XTP/dITP diphosphatase [Deltaproteobacteria bacterium]MBW2121711.1 XTP/dITP diphosphatase [Deltaproteobacteria bacterium]